MGKKIAPPKWWKNTFFWFGFALLILAGWGLVRGEEVIRDPGQVREGGLVMLYAIAAVVMLLNGWISHVQAVRQYEELAESTSQDKD